MTGQNARHFTDTKHSSTYGLADSFPRHLSKFGHVFNKHIVAGYQLRTN